MSDRGVISPLLYSISVDAELGEVDILVTEGRHTVALRLQGDRLDQFVELVNEAAATCRRKVATKPADKRPPCERVDQRAADRAADLAAIQAGLRPWPARPKPAPGRAKRFLRRACSASGRAVAVFALCFAASTLALRLERGPAPTPCAASPSVAPTGTTDAYEHFGIRP